MRRGAGSPISSGAAWNAGRASATERLLVRGGDCAVAAAAHDARGDAGQTPGGSGAANGLVKDAARGAARGAAAASVRGSGVS